VSHECVVRVGLKVCRQSVLKGLCLLVSDRSAVVPEIVAEMSHRAEQQNQLVWVVRQLAGERLRFYQKHRLVRPSSDGSGPSDEVVTAKPDSHR